MNARRFVVGLSSNSASQLDALQTELERVTREVDPQTGVRETLTLAVGMLHRFGSGIVHVDTGRLKNSLIWDVSVGQRGASGVWGTNVEYGIWENARGGDHAFVDRTAREEGPNVARLFAVRISGGRAR